MKDLKYYYLQYVEEINKICQKYDLQELEIMVNDNMDISYSDLEDIRYFYHELLIDYIL